MRRMRADVLTALLVLIVAAPASAQVCGDVNNTGYLSVADVYEMIGYLNHGEAELETGTGAFNWENADCDGKAGFTMGDQVVLCQYLWVTLSTPLHCPPTEAYEVPFPLSSEDVVYVPELYDIPDGVDQVVVTIDVSPQVNTTGFYVPLLIDDEALVNFDFTGATWQQNFFVFSHAARILDSDTLVFSAAPPIDGGWTPRMSLAWLTFERTGPGPGQVAPRAVSRDDLLRPSVIKDDRLLYEPTISYYAATLPGVAGLALSTDHAEFFAQPGGPPPAPTAVAVVGDGQDYDFEVEISDSWIQVAPSPPGMQSTPVTIDISVNPSLLSEGVYIGYVDLNNIDPTQTGFTTERISVGLIVSNPQSSAFVPGDINCSGNVTIGDISVLIDHLYINQSPLDPCE